MISNEEIGLRIVLEILKDSLEEFNKLKKDIQIMSYRGNKKDQRKKLEQRAKLLMRLPTRIKIILDDNLREGRSIINKIIEIDDQSRKVLESGEEYRLKNLIEPKIGKNLLEDLVLEIEEKLKNKTGE